VSAEVPYVSRKRLRVSRRVVVLSVLALLGLGGIAAVLVLKSGGASSRFDGFVYVETNRARKDGNSILAYRFRDNRLSFAAEYPTEGTGAIDPGLTGALDADGQIAVDLRRRLLFAVNQGSDTVAVFRLAADGRLASVPGSPFASGGKAPASVTVAGPFLVVVNKAHDAKRALERTPPRYSVFRIGGNGVLTPTGTPFRAPVSSSPTQALAVSSRVIVGTEESGPFRTFVVGPNGSLFQGANSPLDPEDSLFPARYQGARWAIGIVRHPSGGLIYTNLPARAKLLVYSYDGTGRLTFIRAVDNDGAKLPCWTAVTPDGRRLYTANAGNGTVSAYDLSRNRESPRRLQLLAIERGGNPWGLALDPAGRTLFVVDARATFDVRPGRGNRLHALAVGSDGRLTELDASPVRLPVVADASPLGIAVVPR
jgi:DNA-binding beta-propeller fold protein YncE